jgi:hypothetical protein
VATKRLWSSLAPSTKARYKRNGITAAMYNSPTKRKDNADLFKTAMGKAPQSYLVQRAKELGIQKEIPNFFGLSRKEQDRAANNWLPELKDRPERIKRAKDWGINDVMPFGTLDDTDQIIAADLWLDLMHTKSAQTGHLISKNKYMDAKLQLMGFMDSRGIDAGFSDGDVMKNLYGTRI